MKLGILSDTHGKWDPRIPDHFSGVDLILHAGDIGKRQVLQQLSEIAPVISIRGNNDLKTPLRKLPFCRMFRLGDKNFFLIHNMNDFFRPGPFVQKLVLRHRPHVVISGHSHRWKIEQKGGIIFFNPGSAGPRRFSLPRSVGLLHWVGNRHFFKLVLLDENKSFHKILTLKA